MLYITETKMVFICRVYGKTFYDKSGLNRHVKAQHNQSKRLFLCPCECEGIVSYRRYFVMGYIKKCHPDLVELYTGTHPLMALPMSLKPVKIEYNQDPLIIVEEKVSETITTSSPTHADVAPEMLSMPTLSGLTAQVCDEPAVIPLKAPTTEITETAISQPESKVHFPDDVLDIEIEELFGLDTSPENSAPDLPPYPRNVRK